METWEDFIVHLTRVDFLRLARDEAIEDWGSDIPTTLLFASMGKKIVEHFDKCSTDDLLYIFDVIEGGMRENNDVLKTYVATGLLEALFSRAGNDILLWERIDAQLGEASRNYLIAWRDWH